MKVKKIKKIFICIFCIAVAAAIITFPERYIKSCLEGLIMWAECVVPSLFPFAVISAIFTRTATASKSNPFKKILKKLKMPECSSVCFIISAVSGYPSGSRTVAEFYERGAFRKNDSLKIASLCSTSGPLFVIGSVGAKMFGDKTVGFKILMAHLISVIAVSIVLSLCAKADTDSAQPISPLKKNSDILYECFYGSATAVLNAGAFIVFFYTVSQIICDLNLFYPLEKLICIFTSESSARGLCRGLIESTGGCLLIAKSRSTLAVPLCGFLITFGGTSILLQQLSYLIKTGVKPLQFITVKFIQAILCFFILLLIN